MYTPQILGSDHSEGKYVIEKLPLITLGEIYAFGNHKQYYWKQVFSSIRNVLDDFAKFFNDNSKSGQDSTTLTITVLSFILSALAFMWFFKTFKFYRY